MNIAIISSADLAVPDSVALTVDDIIKQLKQIPNVQILTGGSLGVPGYAVKKAKKSGIPTIAYSPDEDVIAHNCRHDNLDLHHFTEVKHFRGFTMRSLAMFQDADCVLALNGRMGTLSEFTIALEEGKRVGVLTNTGGVADHLKHITDLVQKDFSENLFFSDDPKQVIDWLTTGATRNQH